MDTQIFFNYGIPSALLFWILFRGEKILKEGLFTIERNTLVLENLKTFLETKLDGK